MGNDLIDLLWATDALFQPVRGEFDSCRLPAIAERRADFRRFGLPIRHGGDDTARKRCERRLDDFEEAGVITTHRRHGKRTHWRLSDAADWRLRRTATWTDWPGMATALLVLRSFADAGCVNAGHAYEIDLLTEAERRPETIRLRVVQLQEIFTPALVRGYAVSWPDVDGRIGYALTTSGRQFLDGDLTPPDFAGLEYSTAANDRYLLAFDAAVADLAKARPSNPSLVAIPLSCGNWPSLSTRPDCPSIFDDHHEHAR